MKLTFPMNFLQNIFDSSTDGITATNLQGNIILKGFIRSIQRAEGTLDFFHKAQGYCDQSDYAWWQYCLENLKGSSSEREEGIT